MHGSSLLRMKWFVETWLAALPGQLKILDVGSRDVAGGSYRKFFDPGKYEYTGLDMEPGPNVDVSPQAPYCWSGLADNSFDAVISGQAFEHMEFFWLAAAEMARVLKPGGLLCIIAPRGFERHRYPVDCYRFDADGMVAIARWCGLLPLHATTDMEPPKAEPGWHIEQCEDSMLVAKKPAVWHGVINAETYRFREFDVEPLLADFQPCARLSDLQEPDPRLAELETALKEHQAALDAGEARLAALEQENAALRDHAAMLENSRSWRYTAPLRTFRRIISNLAYGKAIKYGKK